jgi:hypothetical protein
MLRAIGGGCSSSATVERSGVPLDNVLAHFNGALCLVESVTRALEVAATRSDRTERFTIGLRSLAIDAHASVRTAWRNQLKGWRGARCFSLKQAFEKGGFMNAWTKLLVGAAAFVCCGVGVALAVLGVYCAKTSRREATERPCRFLPCRRLSRQLAAQPSNMIGNCIVPIGKLGLHAARSWEQCLCGPRPRN